MYLTHFLLQVVPSISLSPNLSTSPLPSRPGPSWPAQKGSWTSLVIQRLRLCFHGRGHGFDPLLRN